ncbi:MAG: DUF4932 domain-containing protein, partial [Candidatus Aminicenantales bacterium]
SIVQLMSGYKILNSLDFRYKREVINHFSPYKTHPAVGCFSRMSAEGFAFGAPVEMVLCLSDPPELTQTRPFTDFALRRAGGRENLERFASLLREFARDSGFAAFLEGQKDAAALMTAMVRSRLAGTDDVGLLEEYFGKKQHSYTFVFAPLIHGGGFGVRFDAGRGAFDIYSVCGPREVLDDQPQVRLAEDFRYLLWHELSHSFINPTSERLAGRFAPYRGLVEVIKKKGYLKDREKDLAGVPPDLIWGECIDEHVVRAVATRLATRVYGAEAGARRLQNEVANGFIFTPAIAKCLEGYEAHRDKYPTIADFYGEIARTFGEIARQEKIIPLRGIPRT